MSPNPIREFIVGLLRDPEAAAAYRADPARALHAAGLALTPQDIAAVAPMVAESALVPGGERLAAVLAADDRGVPVQDDQVAADVPPPTAETWSNRDISRAFDF